MATFDPGTRAIQVQYLNHRGEIKTYTGDRSTLKAKGGHVTLRLAPTGKRVSFSKDCIQNRAEESNKTWADRRFLAKDSDHRIVLI